MSNKQQQFGDIFDALKVAAEVMQDPLQDSEYRAIAKRLLPFCGAALYRMIALVPSVHKKFPTGWDLEQQIRKDLGKPPMSGLTLEQIEENERKNVVSGQPPAIARKGAEMMRKAVLERPKPVGASFVPPLGESLGTIIPFKTPTKDFSKGITLDPICDLEDFDDGVKNPLASLEDFD